MTTQVLDPTPMHVNTTEAVPAHVRAELLLDQPACAVELDIWSFHFAVPTVRACGIRSLVGEAPLTGVTFRHIPIAALVARSLAEVRTAVRAAPRETAPPQLVATFPDVLPGRNGVIADETLELVAAVYREAFNEQQRPTMAVQRALGCSRSHAGRLVMKARVAGYLGPTTPARAAV